MKPLLLVLALLFVAASPLQAAIAAGGQVTCVQNSSTTTNCVAATALTVATGDTIILAIHTVLLSPPGYTVTAAGCSQTWTHIPYAGQTVDIWYVLSATAGSCTITVSRTSGNDAGFGWVAQDYTGVGAIGAYISASTGSSITQTSPCSSSLTTQDPGNYVLAMVHWNQGTGNSLTLGASTGTTRWTNQWLGSTFRLNDTTAATATAVPMSFAWTISGAVAYCRVNLLELRASATITGSRLARMADQQQTILLSGTASLSYTLPNTAISPTWCTYVMPIGTGTTYQLAVQPPAQLNGQANPITLGLWQMSRVCEDAAGNYSADPAMQGGSGITLTPSSTGITIATGTRTANANTGIRGTVHLGGQRIRSGACGDVVDDRHAGIDAHDTVDYSLARDPGSALATLRIDAFTAVNEVSFRLCNQGLKPITPEVFTVNWYVVR